MPDAPLIAIPDDARKRAITSIRRFFADTMDEEIGDLKATLVLDYVLTELAPTVYNQAIADARAFFEERVADLDGVCHRKEFPLTRR